MTQPATGKVLLYTTALFIAGAVFGAAAMYHFAPPQPAAQQPLKLGRTGEIAAKIHAKLDSGLALTPEQLQKFDPLIAQTSTNLEAIHKDCLDRISAALDLLHSEMGPDLTPAQKQSLKQLEIERAQELLQKYNYCSGTTNYVAH